jgi:hypothetical protein
LQDKWDSWIRATEELTPVITSFEQKHDTKKLYGQHNLQNSDDVGVMTDFSKMDKRKTLGQDWKGKSIDD